MNLKTADTEKRSITDKTNISHKAHKGTKEYWNTNQQYSFLRGLRAFVRNFSLD